MNEIGTHPTPGPLSSRSGLPSVGEGGVPQPSGSGEAQFRVLSWAGFSGAASYTFDDTQPSHFEHWETLKTTGVPMTWYANPTNNWISGYNAMLTEAVSLGHELGNHTMSHCRADLSGCAGSPPLLPVGSAEDEVDQATDYLVALGQETVWSMAYPYGDAGWRSIAEERFLLGRGVQSGQVLPLSNTDPLLLPTVAAQAGDAVGKFVSTIDSARDARAWVIFLFHSIRPTSNDWYAGVDVSVVTESIASAQQVGGVWLDTVAHIGAYFVAEKILTEAEVTTQGDAQVRTWTLPAHFPRGQYLRVTVDGGRLLQGDEEVPWDEHGYYEVALDAGELTWQAN